MHHRRSAVEHVLIAGLLRASTCCPILLVSCFARPLHALHAPVEVSFIGQGADRRDRPLGHHELRDEKQKVETLLPKKAVLHVERDGLVEASEEEEKEEEESEGTFDAAAEREEGEEEDAHENAEEDDADETDEVEEDVVKGEPNNADVRKAHRWVRAKKNKSVSSAEEEAEHQEDDRDETDEDSEDERRVDVDQMVAKICAEHVSARDAKGKIYQQAAHLIREVERAHEEHDLLDEYDMLQKVQDAINGRNPAQDVTKMQEHMAAAKLHQEEELMGKILPDSSVQNQKFKMKQHGQFSTKPKVKAKNTEAPEKEDTIDASLRSLEKKATVAQRKAGVVSDPLVQERLMERLARVEARMH